ncbi:hypothetical protein [Herbaspirillum sp. ST 5-3]|uniref:hypothetical protein n=1 Tax=Oxalobacteraceae TaxID=75682 RepID=UPI0010A5491E|nr:hypothetical protein [Herbaspirillum sp. ST 5-3]
MSVIYLAHVTVYDPDTASEVVLRYCSGTGFVTGTNSAYRPPGVAAHVYYEPRIKQPASMRRDCFSKGTTGGESTIGYGELVLVNSDGGLDAFLDYGLDGREIEIIRGQMDPWQLPTWTTVLLGTMEQPRISISEVAIRLRDRQAELDKPIQPNKFAGSNVLPAGLEGVDGDLKGKPKPKAYGKVYNVAPPCVNTSKLAYQVNDGAVTDITAVYDRGVALTKGADYATSALMLAAVPAAGAFITCFAEGYFMLGSSPAGQITADVTQGAAASNRTVAQVVKSILTGPGGVSSADISASDITDLDTANSAEIGLWVDAEMNIRSALDMLTNSIGAWWGVDRTGVFRTKRLEAPTGTPVATLTGVEIIRLDRVASNDAGAGIPAWGSKLKYKRHWTTQDNDLAGSVTNARRAEIREEWRTVVAEDASVKTAHLLAQELEFETLLVDATASATENTRRLDLYKTRRDRFEVRAGLDDVLASSIDLGEVIEIAYPRFGLDAGRSFVVIGMQPDLRTGIVDLTVWG